MHPPLSVEATDSALRSLPSVALSSAQSGPDSTAAGKRAATVVGPKWMTLNLEGKWSREETRSPQGGTQHAE